MISIFVMYPLSDTISIFVVFLLQFIDTNTNIRFLFLLFIYLLFALLASVKSRLHRLWWIYEFHFRTWLRLDLSSQFSSSYMDGWLTAACRLTGCFPLTCIAVFFFILIFIYVNAKTHTILVINKLFIQTVM